MTQADPTILVVESFPPEVCPICGYSLEGLPGEGICPECGNRYDSSELILHGWAHGQHATAANSRGGGFFFSMLPGFAIVYLWFVTGFSVMRWVFAAIWIFTVGFNLMRRRTTDHPGGIQIRMSRRGIVQINDLASLREHPQLAHSSRIEWKKLKLQKLQVRRDGRIRLRFRRNRPWWMPSEDVYPIDAELNCSAEQAGLLRQKIEPWMRGE